MPDLIPQPHGGAISPFDKRSAGVAARMPTKAIRREGYRILAEGTPEASRKMIERMRSDNEQVSVIAAAQILDRVLGKPSDQPQGGDDERGAVDLSHLTPEERVELAGYVAGIYRLTGRGPGGLLIEGETT